jgi:spermidine synthase
MSALGRHILVEFTGCRSEILNDVSLIEKAMSQSAIKAGATVINSTFHHFSPYGVSGVIVIQESHLAIHTWPEYGYAALDLFTCGDTVDPWISFDELKKIFHAKNHSAVEMYRGSLNMINRADFHPFRSQQATTMKEPYRPQYSRTLWFTDRDENQALSLKYEGDCLYSVKSPYQAVRVFNTTAYGRMLTLDSCIMATERDEMHYHEMLVHPVMQMHQDPRRILVIGGGDGGTIREVFKYPTVEKVVMVEIDQEVVKASQQFFPTLSKEFQNPKLELIFGDGIKYVAEAAQQSFDVVLVDGADPTGPAEGLFSEHFFQSCKRALRPGGLVAAQGESPMFMEKAFQNLHFTMKRVFGEKAALVSLFFAPTYPTGMWSIHYGGLENLNPQKVSKEKIDRFAQEQKLHYYNFGIHQAAFALPRFVSKMLEGEGQ